ncbi:MAG TPA: FUSC family protein [Segeticoccus sp.]|nr:FUSC family protein [Segeticoccus sp.]
MPAADDLGKSSPPAHDRHPRVSDLSAPVWVRQLLRPRPAPIPWGRAVRTSLAVVGPVSTGMATGHLAPGLIGSMGALAASLTDRGGPYRQRAIRVATVAASGAVGFLLGSLVFGHDILAIVLVVGAALVSGLVSVLGNVASVASLQFVIYTVVASGISFGAGPVWLPPLLYLGGAGWELLLSLSTGLGRVSAPERASVAKVYATLSRMLAAVGTSSVELQRQALTAALNEAYDAVIVARSRSGGHDDQFRRLLALLNEATPVVEAALGLVRRGRPVPAAVLRALDATAEAVQHRGDPPEVPSPDGQSGDLAALLSGLGSVETLLAGRQPGDPPQQLVERATVRERLSSAWDALSSGPVTLLTTLRLTLCMGVAEVVMRTLPLQRPYWVALTVAVALKPDFGSVFARAVQRGLGTVVGVLIGTLVIVFVPFGPWILVAMAVFAFLMPVAIVRNYGLFATLLTPVIVLLIDLIHRGNEQLVVYRLIDTLLGSAIVLVVGYLPWPDSWRSRTRIAERFADASDDVLAYLRVALGPDHSARSPLRRHTYRRLSDLRTVFQQALAEPPPVSTWAAAWWPAIVALERLTDAVTALVVHTERGGPTPSAEGVHEVLDAMEDLRAAAREQREPRRLPLPDEEPLKGIVAELHTARGVLSGPRSEPQ